MSLSRRTQVIVLVCVLAVLASLLYVRGFGFRLGGTPSALAGEHASEEAWLTTEIVRDITEMVAFARTGNPRDVRAHAQLVRNGVYRVSVSGALSGDHDLDLSLRLWNVDRFGALAKAMLSEPGWAPSASESPKLHQRLTELTPGRLTGASRELSSALATRMTDAALHESAALTLGAFALRESSGRFNDVRWSLNRMTAHLAMARAVGGARPASVDGTIAEATLLTLANHQASAIAVIEQLETSVDAADVQPWTRALRLRLTQDWALLRDPTAATLLEKFEYLRARRLVTRGLRSVGDFDDLGVNPTDAADWVRILQANPRGVEEGGFLARGVALRLEQKEAVEVRRTFPATVRMEKART